MRTPRFILPAALVALALSACGGGGGDPTPEPTVTSSPDGGPTETPAPEPDPSTVAARVHVGTNNVLIFAVDDTNLADFTMYDPAGEVVATLTEVFGAEPAVSDSAGGLETAPSRIYNWSGFSLIDYEGTTIMNTDFIISVSTASVGDIHVYTYSDLQVGDPMADAIAVSDYDTGFPDYVAIGSIAVDAASVGEPGLSGLAIYVAVSGSGAVISAFTAPSPNWGV